MTDISDASKLLAAQNLYSLLRFVSEFDMCMAVRTYENFVFVLEMNWPITTGAPHNNCVAQIG